jgi:lysozyme family protein
MADLNISIWKTLQNEGGFQAEPNDRANWTGGEIGVGKLVGTKYGITTLDMPGVDIMNITEQQATQYYLEHYVKTLYNQIESQLIADKLFDMGVLFGVEEAVISLQRALRLSNVDGQFGPETLEATNAADPAQLLAGFKNQLAKRAVEIAQERPAEAPNLPGWLRRVNS